MQCRRVELLFVPSPISSVWPGPSTPWMLTNCQLNEDMVAGPGGHGGRLWGGGGRHEMPRVPCTCSVAVPWSMANMLEPVHT